MSVQITIEEDTGLIKVSEIGKAYKNEKYISVQEFSRIILNSLDSKEKFVSPILPKNCIKYISKKNKAEIFLIEKEAHRRDVIYMGTKFRDVGFPKLLFVIELEGKYILRTHILAIKNDLFVKEDTAVYNYPFSNVYPHDKSCCWGSIEKPTIKRPQQLSSLLDYFLSQEDNGDLYNNYTNASGLEYRVLLTKLQGKDFPLEWLRQDKDIKTVGEFLEKILLV